MPLSQPIAVQATDPNGTPLAGRRIKVTPLTASGVVTLSAPVTDADGSAAILYACSHDDHVVALQVSLEEAGAGRPCAIVVLPPDIRLVSESPPGSGRFEPLPRGLTSYDQWKFFNQPGMNLQPAPPPTPILFVELRTCDLGETAFRA